MWAKLRKFHTSPSTESGYRPRKKFRVHRLNQAIDPEIWQKKKLLEKKLRGEAPQIFFGSIGRTRNEQTKERKNERTNERTDGRTDGRMDGQMDGRTDERMNEGGSRFLYADVLYEAVEKITPEKQTPVTASENFLEIRVFNRIRNFFDV